MTIIQIITLITPLAGVVIGVGTIIEAAINIADNKPGYIPNRKTSPLCDHTDEDQNANPELSQ